MNILYAKSFLRGFKKLSPEVRKTASEKEDVFIDNSFEKSLKTHKLKGKLKGCYSFSVDFNYRIVFRFIDKNTVLFLLIGNHSIYQ